MTGVRTAIVIGAGPAGLATAVALREAGIEAVVYERGAALSDEGGGLTLWPNGLAALASFGVADDVHARSLASPGTAMWTHDGRVLSEMTGPELDGIGGRGLALHRAELLGALADRLDPDMIRFRHRCVAVRSHQDGATAVFEDGTEEDADLLAGADGIRSRIRTSCVSDRPLRHGGFVVWRATIEYRLPRAPGMLAFGGPHQFGIWRLPSDQVYWFASAPVAEAAQQHVPARPPTFFHRWHDPVGALIDATATEQITVSAGYDCAPLPRWNAGHVVLVGDAAHPTLPNMGQGVSQAFEDAAVLAEELRLCPDVHEALRQYHRRRRRRARSAWSQARLLARVGAWRNPLACRLRETMIAAAPQSAQIRQLERLFAFETPPPPRKSRHGQVW